jgi:hypothetical protein
VPLIVTVVQKGSKDTSDKLQFHSSRTGQTVEHDDVTYFNELTSGDVGHVLSIQVAQ